MFSVELVITSTNIYTIANNLRTTERAVQDINVTLRDNQKLICDAAFNAFEVFVRVVVTPAGSVLLAVCVTARD